MDEKARTDEAKVKNNKKVIIGISGSSGIIYGIKTVEFLSKEGYNTFVIVTKPAIKVAKEENDIDLISELSKFTKKIFLEDQIDAPMASSSFTVTTKGMIIIPCSINTLAYIASGITSNLLTRTAINFLRTKRRLILVIRETPLGEIELENALKVSKAGGIIMPASPGFYIKPETIDDMINFIVGKAIDLLGIKNSLYRRWSK
ncbi:UbiX family flavin prenyltransferase [Acidianus sulfidivorans JP7]|uniref:Flavin prenyltransferase UbiX n=1 Tax=Acidianus sulfidivorans JP7 TaxID=619593 RepID=A0A2U9IM91_9CREN|nr:UbiX family flavin prenyltransferase [Acidianus sulfidivorans]AWR97146.1 UbiX family flavin prenyltransferase [Acidianus sulfidivorans JP7]